MNKKRTKEIGRTKYLMFIPLAALLMIISNIETVARTTEKIATEVMEAVDMPIVEKRTMSIPEATEPSAVPEKMERDSLINESDNIVFEVVEHMPEFANGGMSGLMEYLNKNIQYPADAHAKGLQGRVTIQFVVEKDGSITGAKVLRGADPSLDKEAIRVASAMPKWKPGMQRGKAVRVKYTVPVMFRLTEEKSNDKGKVVDPKYVPTPADKNVVFEVVEQMPEFPGGMAKLMEYISKNIQYPAEAQTAGTQGRVIIQMIIDENGKINNPRVLQGVDPLLDAEAIRLMNAMPNWKPGTQRGVTVKVKYTIPVVFRLQ